MPFATVLVVEDNDDLRSLFRDALMLAGFRVREASDGLEALRSVDSGPPDLIVLDIGLPQVNGRDILHELSAHPHTREIPVVVVTGLRDDVPHVSPDCLLLKPVMPSELVRKVQSCLQPRL